MPRERPSYGKVIDPQTNALRYVSVSQVSTFDPYQPAGCNRAWFFEKKLGKKRPKIKAQELGDEVHEQSEIYLKTGEDSLGSIARQGKHFLPAPLTEAPGILIEHEFGGVYGVGIFEQWRQNLKLVSAGQLTQEQAARWYETTITKSNLLYAHNVPFVGYIDLVNERDYWVDTEGVRHYQPPDIKEVHDHKTTFDIQQGAKSAQSLPNTTQMNGYGEWVRRTYPNVQKVRLSHGYLQTRGRGAEKRTILVSIDDIQRRWQHTEQQVLRMTQAALETDPAHVEANYESCDAYRTGCPHKSYCPRDPARVLADLLGGDPMSMLDAIQGVQGAAVPQGAPMTQPAAFAQTSPMQPSPQQAPVSHCSCGGVLTPSVNMIESGGQWWHMTTSPHPAVFTQAQQPQQAAQPPPRSTIKLEHGLILQHREKGHRCVFAHTPGGWTSQAINPDNTLGHVAGTQPDLHYDDTWASLGLWSTAMASTTHNPNTNTTISPNQGSPSFAAVAPPDAPQSLSPANAQAIPPGTVLPSAVAAAAAQHAASVAAAAQTPAETSTKRGRPKGSKNKATEQTASSVNDQELVLFVDCTYGTFDTEDLEPYVAQIMGKLAAAAQLNDIRLAGPEHALGYNRWKAAIEAAVKLSPPPANWYFLRVGGNDVKPSFVDALRALGAVVVEPLK